MTIQNGLCDNCQQLPPLIRNNRTTIRPRFCKWVSGGFIQNTLIPDKPDMILCEPCDYLLTHGKGIIFPKIEDLEK